jgi:hypothetical protein
VAHVGPRSSIAPVFALILHEPLSWVRVTASPGAGTLRSIPGGTVSEQPTPSVKVGDTVLVRMDRHIDRAAYDQHEAAEDAAEAAAKEAGKRYTRKANPVGMESRDLVAMVERVDEDGAIGAHVFARARGTGWRERIEPGTGDGQWRPR